ncbi:VTC domain-containing protein [Verrucosispora sp. WMMA2044]|uniref:VTC domain-containing protein n=1 Tax=Verrucosispora sp. WMMA2044 TaxID=3016419 RepID=UPI00248D016C|nr:VTC domain-containing protein [Verrucosispora sp. WMMA2044]WBB51714.1 VTC domain-containing protein [Verrucosispora sp. WMMA2044]
MSSQPITAPLAAMDPIGLAELIDRAALQTRVDRKYLVPLDRVPHLLDQLTPYARVLDIDGARSFRYESVYFDTPMLASYHCAAYRRRRRFKVRVVETKTSAAASPADRLLWQGGLRPARISKYATGLAALRPELPDSPWRRTLRRHFRTTPSVGTAPTATAHRPVQEASCV